MLRNFSLFLILIGTAGWAAPGLAADWPQWGGADPGRNMVSAEKGLPESFVPGQKDPQGRGVKPDTTRDVRWAVRLGSYIYGNPTVSGGKVFAGTDDESLQGDGRFERTNSGMVRCLDEATGRLLWQLAIPRRTSDRLPPGAHFGQQHYGVCSSPAVDGNRVYVVTNTAEVLCLDANGLADGNNGPFTDEGRYMAGPGKTPIELRPSDADIIWVADLIQMCDICPHDVTSCSPLVHGRFVYLETGNGVEKEHVKCLRPDAPSFIALDKETGRLVAGDEEKLGRRMFHCLWSPPSLGVVGGRPLVFFGGGDGILYAFEEPAASPEKPVAFKKVWSYDAIPPQYKVSDGKPVAYIDGDKRRKSSPNKDDGTYVGPSEILGTPVFYKNRVYTAIGEDPAHGRGRGMLHCIDATRTGDITETGRVWTYDGIERAMGSVAIADGLLYAADLGGRVHCLDAETGKLIWVHDLKAETWGTPFVADGKVYVGTKKNLSVLAAGREPRQLAAILLGSPSYGTPVAANGTLFVTSQQYLWAVQAGAKPAP